MPTQRTGRREAFRKTLVMRAREMRNHMPQAERVLWSALCRDQVSGLRFRRQHRLGSYIADFYCPAVKLVIEVDGDSHGEQADYDAKRTCWMSQRGMIVLRFSNEEVMKHLEAVVEVITSRCVEAMSPSPQPSPRNTGNREKKGRPAG